MQAERTAYDALRTHTALAMDLGAHPNFILGAYSVALLNVAALSAWVIVANRRQRQILSDLEARGIMRRSERAAERQPLP